MAFGIWVGSSPKETRSRGWDWEFESGFLQRWVSCEPVFLVKDPEHLQILESAGYDRPDCASELKIDPSLIFEIREEPTLEQGAFHARLRSAGQLMNPVGLSA
jgi:hypothetical protein